MRDIALQILRNAILQIRVAGWQGRAAYCAVEADHIHNLPELLNNYRPHHLNYCIDLEIPGYLADLRRRPEEQQAFGGAQTILWDALRRYRDKHNLKGIDIDNVHFILRD